MFLKSSLFFYFSGEYFKINKKSAERVNLLLFQRVLLVHPLGIEPGSKVPETSVLSIKLWVHDMGFIPECWAKIGNNN